MNTCTISLRLYMRNGPLYSGRGDADLIKIVSGVHTQRKVRM